MISEADKAKLQVGYKQVQRALNENKAAKAFVAANCDKSIKDGIERLTSASGIPLFIIDTMKELGEMCSIEVGASCAAVLK